MRGLSDRRVSREREGLEIAILTVVLLVAAGLGSMLGLVDDLRPGFIKIAGLLMIGIAVGIAVVIAGMYQRLNEP